MFNNDEPENTEVYKVKSLAKALGLFDHFALETPERGITELADLSGLLKSSVHNMVSTFCACGFLEKNEISGKYRLGVQILKLSNQLYQSHDLRNLIRPYMEKISAATCESVYLGILSDGEVLYIDAVSPCSNYSARSIIGVKAPLYCTGVGKALMAYLPETMVKRIAEARLERFTPNTICDPHRLELDLALIRSRGYSIDDMEHEYGIKCVAVPIKNLWDATVASLSVSGPSLRFTEKKILEHADFLLAIQKELKPLIRR